MAEVGADAAWPLRETAQGVLEIVLAAGRRLARGGLLQVGVQALVGGQLGAVRGQVEHFDVRSAPSQPVLHRSGAMDRQVSENAQRFARVQDQEHLAASIPDLALHEADQAWRLDRAIQDHPA